MTGETKTTPDKWLCRISGAIFLVVSSGLTAASIGTAQEFGKPDLFGIGIAVVIVTLLCMGWAIAIILLWMGFSHEK